MPPQWSNLVLPTNIPHIEFDVLVCDRLDVEAYCRDRGDVLVKFQLIKDCCQLSDPSHRLPSNPKAGGNRWLTCLASRIESQHQKSHFS